MDKIISTSEKFFLLKKRIREQDVYNLTAFSNQSLLNTLKIDSKKMKENQKTKEKPIFNTFSNTGRTNKSQGGSGSPKFVPKNSEAGAVSNTQSGGSPNSSNNQARKKKRNQKGVSQNPPKSRALPEYNLINLAFDKDKQKYFPNKSTVSSSTNKNTSIEPQKENIPSLDESSSSSDSMLDDDQKLSLNIGDNDQKEEINNSQNEINKGTLKKLNSNGDFFQENNNNFENTDIFEVNDMIHSHSGFSGDDEFQKEEKDPDPIQENNNENNTKKNENVMDIEEDKDSWVKIDVHDTKITLQIPENDEILSEKIPPEKIEVQKEEKIEPKKNEKDLVKKETASVPATKKVEKNNKVSKTPNQSIIKDQSSTLGPNKSTNPHNNESILKEKKQVIEKPKEVEHHSQSKPQSIKDNSSKASDSSFQIKEQTFSFKHDPNNQKDQTKEKASKEPQKDQSYAKPHKKQNKLVIDDDDDRVIEKLPANTKNHQPSEVEKAKKPKKKDPLPCNPNIIVNGLKVRVKLDSDFVFPRKEQSSGEIQKQKQKQKTSESGQNRKDNHHQQKSASSQISSKNKISHKEANTLATQKGSTGHILPLKSSDIHSRKLSNSSEKNIKSKAKNFTNPTTSTSSSANINATNSPQKKDFDLDYLVRLDEIIRKIKAKYIENNSDNPKVKEEFDDIIKVISGIKKEEQQKRIKLMVQKSLRILGKIFTTFQRDKKKSHYFNDILSLLDVIHEFQHQTKIYYLTNKNEVPRYFKMIKLIFKYMYSTIKLKSFTSSYLKEIIHQNEQKKLIEFAKVYKSFTNSTEQIKNLINKVIDDDKNKKEQHISLIEDIEGNPTLLKLSACYRIGRKLIDFIFDYLTSKK